MRTPTANEGLSFISLVTFNEAANLKLGNGNLIQFWTDSRCDNPLILETSKETLVSQGINLYSKVTDFIHDGNWSLPQSWNFPFLTTRMPTLLALKVQDVDVLIWPTSTFDSLTLKDAYHFKSYPTLNLQWAKEVWCTDIPSSKSILVWKLINKRLHTDDLLKARGCIITSVYDLYRSDEESIQHLFFDCAFAKNLWN
ncbi:hypothetical protein KIW84_013985 [Lathyrus oleraceus]|uniref:Reverse transcriptase zinc-binding domain-containing protein n=1 Tax=Pisum sativum TaxID=3888 RepID=A0A9D5GYX5_PEA|nr:hypothetical protein KIW84_013985 [Pisum sativum]